MAVNVPYNYIQQEIAANNLRFWDIKAENKLIARYDADTSTDVSLEVLKTKLSDIQGQVKINASDQPSHERGAGPGAKKTRTFFIDTTQTPITNNNSAVNMNYHSPQYEKLQHEILNLEREKLALKYACERWEDKYNDLQNKYNELQKEAEENEPNEQTIDGTVDKITKTIENIAPILAMVPSLLQSLNTKPAPSPNINGLPDLWQQYRAMEPDADAILNAVIKIKKNEPWRYSFIKKTLLK